MTEKGGSKQRNRTVVKKRSPNKFDVFFRTASVFGKKLSKEMSYALAIAVLESILGWAKKSRGEESEHFKRKPADDTRPGRQGHNYSQHSKGYSPSDYGYRGKPSGSEMFPGFHS